jgi:hypothetical protein
MARIDPLFIAFITGLCVGLMLAASSSLGGL